MDKLREILRAANSKIDYDKETALIDGGLIDSLELMEIISEIEAAYDIEIGMEEITPENFNSPEAICKMIERLRA